MADDPRTGDQVGRYRVATYNIGAYDYPQYAANMKTAAASCGVIEETVKKCRQRSSFADRRAKLKKIIGRVRAKGTAAAAKDAASIVVLQELSNLNVYTSRPVAGKPRPATMTYANAVSAAMEDLGYTRPTEYPDPDDPGAQPQEGTGTVTADKDTRIKWTTGTQIFFQSGFYQDITIKSSKLAYPGVITATEAMAAAVKGTAVTPLLVKDYSGSNRTEKVFPYARLKVAGDSTYRAREQVLVAGVHLPLPKPTVLAAKFKSAGPWIQESLVAGLYKLLAPMEKKKPKASTSSKTTTSASIPMVIMGDFNANYAPVDVDYVYKYKKSGGGTGQVHPVSPTQKLVALKMKDTRAKRWGVDALSGAQKENLTTLNKKTKTGKKRYDALDYVFYRWKDATKVANFQTKKDGGSYVSDHRKIAVTLWFQ
jgi:hypothetical protein